MKYDIHYDIAALFIVIAVGIHFFMKRRVRTRQNRIFTLLMIFSMISNVFDIITVYTIEHPSSVPLTVNYILNDIYLISFNFAPMVYYAYISLATSKGKERSKAEMVSMLLPITIVTLLIIATPITHFVYYFKDGTEYTHGFGMYALYLSAFYYLLRALVTTIIHHKQMIRAQLVAVLFYTLSSFVATVMQLLIDNLLLSQFMLSLSVMLIYLSLESPDAYTDKRYSTYNNAAFMEAFNLNVYKKRKFGILGVYVEGIKDIKERIGIRNSNELLKTVAEFLIKIAGRNVYCVSDYSFYIMSDFSNSKWKQIQKSIQERFKEPFNSNGADIVLTARMCMYNSELSNRYEDVCMMLEHFLEKSRAQGVDKVINCDEKELEESRYKSRVLQALREAVRSKSFDVYYQPIHSVKENRFTTAEALIRLRTEELGFVSPEVFIPMAEENGLIIEIGEIVFRKVCAFYIDNKLDKRGIEYIHVNLSAIECMQEKLHHKLIRIMDEYKLPYKRLRLEITETAAVFSQDNLRNNMQKLIDKGVYFAMDDYGTGFSNTATMFNYPFSEIKLDKSIIWSAMTDENAMVVLKHTVAMIKELALSIVAEGVETIEQANILKDIGVDFFQGYFYSKPVSGNDFIALLE